MNQVLKNIDNQVLFVNPFNRIYESSLFEQFEEQFNSPSKIQNRSWNPLNLLPNNAIISDYDFMYRRSISPKSFYEFNIYSEIIWLDIKQTEVPYFKEQNFMIKELFSAKSIQSNHIDIDAPFNINQITNVFKNITLKLRNETYLFFVNGGQASLEANFSTKTQDFEWKIMTENKIFQYNFPIGSLRQFKSDLYRLDIDLEWNPYLNIKDSYLTFNERNNPKLSFIIDSFENSLLISNERNGINTIRLNDDLTVIFDHNEKKVYLNNKDFIQNQKLLMDIYTLIMDNLTYFGRNLNQFRDKMYNYDNISLTEFQFLNELIFMVQRKVTQNTIG